MLKDFHKTHLDFHTKYPEKFSPDECISTGGIGLNEGGEGGGMQLPSHFGNVCLRFIPVFEIVVHR